MDLFQIFCSRYTRESGCPLREGEKPRPWSCRTLGKVDPDSSSSNNLSLGKKQQDVLSRCQVVQFFFSLVCLVL